MTKRGQRLGIGAIAALLILIAVWSALRPHTPAPIPALTRAQTKNSPPSAQTARATPAATIHSNGATLWIRASPEVTSRNRRRSGFAWIMRLLGMTENQLDRLIDGDALSLVNELKDKARAGDPVSINLLGAFITMHCSPEQGSLITYDNDQIAQAQASSLSQTDKDWYRSTVNDDIAFEKQLSAVCDQIDTNEVLSWVTARANQGDGASLWVLWQGPDKTNTRYRVIEAAAAGFAPAQFLLAAFGTDEEIASEHANKLSREELFNQSARAFPGAKSELAECEYFGDCGGITIDIDAAIANAREAAQAGFADAIVRIGPHLPAGQMDPKEVSAWSLIDASLELQGCHGSSFMAETMQKATATLNAVTITPQARALAEQYWSDYGSQIMANLGCTS